MSKLDIILNDRNKKLFWWNKNYFFIGTLSVVIITILIFAFVNNWQWTTFPIGNGQVSRMLRVFFNGFSHSSWEHVLSNMFCFLVVGVYLERKIGSLWLVGFVIAAAFFAAGAMAMASPTSPFASGFSGINYLIYSYIIIEYLFLFEKSNKNKKNKFNIIFGAVIIGLIYIVMCFNVEANPFSFEGYPFDLINNMWHYSSFIAGIFVGLIIQLSQFKERKELQYKVKLKRK